MRSLIRLVGLAPILLASMLPSGCNQGGDAPAGESGNPSGSPPQVVYQSPFRLFPFAIELPSVSVTFSEPVHGLSPADLEVQGARATRVAGDGAGPYVFTGFSPPGLGAVPITLVRGSIRNSRGVRFEGYAWSLTLVDPEVDGDGDGLPDGEEVTIHHTRPDRLDTDGDGLPDGYEIRHPCLDPLVNEANELTYGGPPNTGTDDADHDGRTNLEEFQSGTDPCVAD